MDSAVARFLQNHCSSEREAVRADVEPYLGMSLEEKGRILSEACRLAASLLRNNPQRESLLARQEAPHPSYFALLEKLRRHP